MVNKENTEYVRHGIPPCDLAYGSVDLHYHAGAERYPGTSMEDYLDFARATGRVVLGITDHFGYCFPGRDKGPRPYPGSMQGFLRFIQDIDNAAEGYPMLRVFKCPELGAATLHGDIPDGAVEASHFFLCEPPGLEAEDTAENTARRLEHVRMASAFLYHTSTPVILVHPFRDAVNLRLVKRSIEPWVTQLEHRANTTFPEDELNRFFMFDVRLYADACKEYGLPVEVNGETDLRVRLVNLTTPHRMLLAAYRLLRDSGVELVPGSDLHGIRTGVGSGGAYVPSATFECLDLMPGDSEFVRNLLSEPAMDRN